MKFDYRKVTRQSSKSPNGIKFFYPRIELTGEIIADAGYEYQDEYFVTVDDPSRVIIITPKKSSFDIKKDDETGIITLTPKKRG